MSVTRDELLMVTGDRLASLCREKGLKVTESKDAKINRLLKDTGR